MSYDALQRSRYSGKPFELYRFTMGTTVWQVTSSEEIRTHPVHGLFTPEAISRSDISMNQETSSGELEINLPLTSAIAQEFIVTVPPLPIWITLFAGHDGDAEVITMFRGVIAKATFEEDCRLLAQPETAALRRKIPGPVYQTMCNRVLYSPDCGANSSAHSWTVKVGSIAADGVTVTVNAGATESAAYAAYWAANWSASADTAGPPSLAWGFTQDAEGHRMMIALHPSANVFVLKSRMYGLAVGDVITVFRGCRRTIKHCRAFGRQSSFMGFDIFPSKNPFNGVV